MDKCNDSLRNLRVFSAIDANLGYLQIRVADKSIPYTAFVCRKGFYVYNRISFWLTNAQETFQRSLDIILAGFKLQIV